MTVPRPTRGAGPLVVRVCGGRGNSVSSATTGIIAGVVCDLFLRESGQTRSEESLGALRRRSLGLCRRLLSVRGGVGLIAICSFSSPQWIRESRNALHIFCLFFLDRGI